MADPKIRVSADVSGVEQALSKVQEAIDKTQQSLSGGKLGVPELQADFDALVDSAQALQDALQGAAKIGLDGAEVDKVAQALDGAAQAAQALDQAMAGLGKQGGASAAVKGAKDIADNLARAARAQQLLAQDGIKLSREQVKAAKEQFDVWRKSGARGTSKLRDTQFDDWIAGGWRSYSLDEQEARRHRDRVLRSIGIERASEASGMRRVVGGPRLAGALGAVSGVAGSMFGGGSGGMWGSVGSGLGAGAGALAGLAFGGPIGAAVGLVAGRLLGGLGSAMDRGIQDAGIEGAALTDLRRSIGATTTDFEDLRAEVRQSTEGLGIAFNEAAGYAREFSRSAGGGTEGLGTALRFGRGYGIDPALAARFFGEARLRGVAETDREGRRLAVHIAEAVQRGGMTARMDEVLQSLQGYMAQASRASLTSVNAEGYLSLLSSLGALGLPGLRRDPAAAAAMLSSADAAIRQGGAFGEASKNFSLGVYQRLLPGFTALDMDVLNEQGAFGSVARAFGPESPAYRLAQERGDEATMRRYEGFVAAGGDRSLLGLHMQALETEYGGSTDDLRKALQSHFGLSASGAAALYQAYRSDGGLGGLERALSASGIDVSRLDVKQLGALASIARGDRADLTREANRLLGMGSAVPEIERQRLQQAVDGGDTETLRQVLLSSSALRDTLKDEGERQRDLQADMRNSLQRLATELIPATLAIQEGIVELVRILPFGDKDYVRRFDEEKLRRLETAEKARSLDTWVGMIDRQIAEFKPADPTKIAGMQQSLAQLRRLRDEAKARGEPTAPWDANIAKLEAAIRAASPEGLEDLKAQRERLAGERDRVLEGKPTAAPWSGKDPRNLRNNNPGNIVYGEFARKHGAIGSDGRFAIFPDAETGSRAMDALLMSYGRRGHDTVREVIGRWAPPSENNTSAYAATVAKRLGVGLDEPLMLSDPSVRAALAREIARFEGAGHAYVPPGEGRLPASVVRQQPSPSMGPITVNVGGELRVVDQYNRPTGQVVPLARMDAPQPAGVVVR